MVRDYVADIEDLARRAGLPRPRITVIDNDQPNAFATGRDPDHAAVAASTGLLGLLDRDEIRGVMAHELAHVKNRDTLTMTVTATIAGAISALANFAFFFGGSRDDDDRPGGMIGTIALAILAPIAAMLVQMAISRSREYEADRIGAEIAGDPGPGPGAGEDRGLCPRRRGQPRGRAQSGHGAPVHHQPAIGQGRRQPVLDPPGHPQPRRGPAAAGRQPGHAGPGEHGRAGRRWSPGSVLGADPAATICRPEPVPSILNPATRPLALSS
jgi:hypothetical protein